MSLRTGAILSMKGLSVVILSKFYKRQNKNIHRNKYVVNTKTWCPAGRN